LEKEIVRDYSSSPNRRSCTLTADQPAFVAEEPEHCHDC
jgi:hypothetical protein